MASASEIRVATSGLPDSIYETISLPALRMASRSHLFEYSLLVHHLIKEFKVLSSDKHMIFHFRKQFVDTVKFTIVTILELVLKYSRDQVYSVSRTN